MKKLLKTTVLASTTFLIGLTSCKKDAELAATKESQIASNIDIIGHGFDVNLFRANLIKAFDGKTVGYSFAIGKDGQVLPPTAGGNARLDLDGAVKYTTNTRQGIGSTSKTITALAIMKGLKKRGLTDTAKIKDFLPTGWKMPAVNQGITFKDVLAHSAGLTNFGADYPALKKTVETPTTGIGSRLYNNVNYTLCRVLVAYLVSNRSDLEGGFDPNYLTCIAYYQFVLNEIFKPAGVQLWDKIQIGPWNESNTPLDKSQTLYYNYSNQSLNGITRNTTIFEGGPGGWYMNPTEVAQVMVAAEAGKIIPKDMMARMKSLLLGFDGIVAGEQGTYTWKNGNWVDGQGRGIYTVIMHFPNNVQVVWHTNARQTNIGGPEAAISKAYDDAWR